MQSRRRVVVGVVAAGVAAVAVAGVVALGATRGDPALAAVHVEPSAVQGCLPAAVTVTLDRAAPADGLVVGLTSSSPVVAVPRQLTVPAGATEMTVAADTVPVAAAERAQVRAAAAGSDATATVEVSPVEAATVAEDPDPACLTGFTDLHGYTDPERVGAFDAAAIPEASGLAASRRNPGWWYVVDDERPRAVSAVRADGSDRTPIPLAGFQGRDTEALAVGPCDPAGQAHATGPTDPAPCVYVGDIGDNLAQHADVAILRFPEPDLSEAGPVGAVEPETIRVSYPDGPANAEALLVGDAGAVYIVTKDPGPDGEGAARLYATDGFAGGTLTDLGPVAVPEPARPLVAGFRGVEVTGGDHRDGRVALRTYDAVVEYVAPAPGASLAHFPSWPVREVPAARQPQSEAVAYAADGCGYATVSEMVGDIWFVGCR